MKHITKASPIFTRRQPLSIVGLLICVLLLLPACNPSPVPPPELEAVTLQLKWFHQFQHAGYYAAVEQGFYREAGLDVKLVEGNQFDVVEEVMSGRAQYGVSTTDILLRRLEGDPLVVLAAIFQHAPGAFMVRRDSGIDNPQELAGKHIRLSDEYRTANLQATLIEEGISLDQVTIVRDSTPPSDYIFDETIDAFGIYASNEPFYWLEADIPFTLIEPINYGIDFYGDSLYTTERELADHPDRVRRVRAASLRGWEYAMAHPEEIVDLILEKYDSNKSREHLLYEAEQLREYILPELVEIGHMNPGRWEHIADTYVQLGLVEPGYSLDGFIYDPGRPPDLTWFYNVMGFLGWLLLLASLGGGVLLVFNKRLRKLVAQRTAELQRSEAYYRSIFDNALNAILIVDDEANYTEANPAACRLLGYSREEMLSKRIPDMLPSSNENPEAFQAAWHLFLAEKLQTGEYQLKNKAGQIIQTEYQAVVNFVPGRHLSIMQDVTERKQAEKALRESEARFRAVWEIASDAMALSDPDGVVLVANPAYVKLYGYPLEEVVGQPFTVIYPPERRAAALENYRRVFAEPEIQSAYEAEFKRDEGKSLFVESRIGFITDADGQRTAMLSIIRDVTQRKETEAALRRSEERFRTIANNGGMVVAQIDKELRYVWLYNPPYPEQFSQEKIVGKRDDELSSFGGVKEVMAFKQEVLATETGRRQEMTIIEPSGPVTYDIFAEPWYDAAGDLIGLTTIAIDVTEQRKMEAALRESREKFRHSQQFLQKIYDEAQVSLFVIEVTPDGDFRYVGLNPAHQRLTRLSNADIAGKPPEAVPGLTPETAAYLRSRYDHCIATRGPVHYEEHFEIDGRDNWWLTQLSPLIDESGRIYQIIGSCINITEQKRAEQRIRQLSQAVEQSPEAIIITNAQEEIEYVNPAFTAITGYRFAEVEGRNPRFLRSGRTSHKVYEALHATISAGQTYRCEFLNKKKSDELYWVQSVVSPIKDEQGRITHLLSIQQDISERKRLEQERAKLETHLRQSQRLETIGTLAGGIAHDFNNILTPIIGYTDLASDDLPDDHPVQTDLKRVTNAATRARDLVRQILTFSRQVEHERIPIELQPLIKEVLTLLRPSLPATIEIRREVAPDCGPIRADTAQIHQILMNLCTNAYHAMEEEGGVLTIGLDQIGRDDLDQPLPSTLERETYARLTVADTGHGMDAATLERIFEPFFTTKPPGKGTGLGLSVVHGIVKSHEGAILVHSEPGQGTQFDLYFPICVATAAAEAVIVAADDRDEVERILVVDDEVAIVEMLSHWLTKSGYQVVGRGSSTDAMDLFLEDTNAFDLVITDLTMPKMTGLQLARQMTALRPNLPIILLTGDAGRVSQADLEQSGIKTMLTKPILFTNLSFIIRRLLA